MEFSSYQALLAPLDPDYSLLLSTLLPLPRIVDQHALCPQCRPVKICFFGRSFSEVNSTGKEVDFERISKLG
jgi:hypothetical protein